MEGRRPEEWDGFDISTFKCSEVWAAPCGLIARSTGSCRKEPSESLQLCVLRITNLKTGVSPENSFYSLFSACSGQPAFCVLLTIILQNEVCKAREERLREAE